MNLKFFEGFIIFMVVFFGIGWLIEKTNFDIKIVNTFKDKKHLKSVLFVILLISGFFLEVSKQMINEHLGKHNFVSTILGAVMFAIYFKFFPYIFEKKNNI